MRLSVPKSCFSGIQPVTLNRPGKRKDAGFARNPWLLKVTQKLPEDKGKLLSSTAIPCGCSYPTTFPPASQTGSWRLIHRGNRSSLCCVIAHGRWSRQMNTSSVALCSPREMHTYKHINRRGDGLRNQWATTAVIPNDHCLTKAAPGYTALGLHNRSVRELQCLKL